MALALMREDGQELYLDVAGTRTVVRVCLKHGHGSKRVMLTIEAPPEVKVLRAELAERIAEVEGRKART